MFESKARTKIHGNYLLFFRMRHLNPQRLQIKRLIFAFERLGILSYLILLPLPSLPIGLIERYFPSSIYGEAR